MLSAAGVSQHDPILPSLLRVDRLCPLAMEQLYYGLDPHPIHGTLYELLAAIVSRGRPLTPELQAALPRWAHDRRERIYLAKLQAHKTTYFDQMPDGMVSCGRYCVGLPYISPNAGKMRSFLPLPAAHCQEML